MKSGYNDPKGMLMLFGAALIWGTTFVAQSMSVGHVGAFTFNASRCLAGACVLLPVILIRQIFMRDRARSASPEESRFHGWPLAGGALCGFFLFVASNLQQAGIAYTTVGKAGFITAMYIVLVPVLGIFVRRAPCLRVWMSVALAVAGLYLLCVKERVVLQTGDFYMLLCAAAFAVQILCVDYFAPRCDGMKLACTEFSVCGILSAAAALIAEKPQPEDILSAWGPILYAGILSCGIAYTLQITGQKRVDPTIGSLIMSLESVISLLAGWVVLGQAMSGRELAGCVVMFAAIILAQLPEKQKTEIGAYGSE